MRRPIVWILILLVLAGGAAFFIVPPIAQPQWYHNFADQRFLLGIPNFWNVISNLPFFLVGVWGVGYLVSEQSLQTIDGSIERWMYLFLFVGVALTGVGSAYYHLEPDNERLVWDRLPIAMTFMALFAIIMAERLNRRVGVWLFLPLVLVGAASVFYWHVTETLSRGDLRLYLMLSGGGDTLDSLALSSHPLRDRKSLWRHWLVCKRQALRVLG
jgi:hypothetical protein